MKVVFSKHAKQKKFPMLAKHGFRLSEVDMVNVLKNPEHEDKTTNFPNIIASKSFDGKHILRVV